MKTPNRCLPVRASLAALAVLFAAIALPASAMTVSAPAGGVMPSNAPFVVQWVSTPGPGQVGITIESSGPQYGAGTFANTGQASIAFPATATCDPASVFRIRVIRYTTNTNPYTYHDQGVSAPFTFACPITVTKQVVNTTGRHVGGTFRMRVQCEPGSQTFADIVGSGQGAFSRKVHVPVGSTFCTVQETGMPMPPRGCSWLTTYPGGQQRQPGGPPVIVVNTLQCGPVIPPGPR